MIRPNTHQGENEKFSLFFDSAISSTEQQLLSTIKSPSAMDYVRKLGNKRWGIGLGVTTLSLATIGLNKTYHGLQSDPTIIANSLHLKGDTIGVSGSGAIENFVDLAQSISDQNDIDSYTDALPDYEKNSLREFLELMSVDSALFIKNNNLFITPDNLKKILDENANRWIVDHKESSQNGSVIRGLAFLIGLLMLGNYAYKVTKFEYQKALQDMSKKAKEIQKEAESAKLTHLMLFDILKAHNAGANLSEDQKNKQLITAKNIKLILIDPYFSSDSNPLVKGEKKPNQPFPIEYSYTLMLGLPDTMISSTLMQKVKANKQGLYQLKDVSQFSGQNVSIYDQYREVMISLKEELNVIITNADIINNWKDNKQEIVSQISASPETVDLSNQLMEIDQNLATIADKLRELQMKNKGNSSHNQEELDRLIGKLTNQIEIDGVGSSDFSELNFDELKNKLASKVNLYKNDIILDEDHGIYVYTNIESYERLSQEDKDNINQQLNEINTIYSLLLRRILEMERGVLKDTSKLKKEIEEFTLQKESIIRQLEQIKNHKSDALTNTIIKTIDNIINGKTKIIGTTDQQLVANAYKHIVNQLIIHHPNVFRYDQSLSEHLANKVNNVDKQFGVDAVMFGAHRGTAIMGGYHATRQILNIEQIGNLFDNPNHYMAAGGLIALIAGFGVHKFIHGVEGTALWYENRSMDKKMPLKEIILQKSEGSSVKVSKIALFLGVALTTLADVGGSIATITSAHQKEEATKQVMEGSGRITQSIDEFESFIHNAKGTSLSQARKTIIDEAKNGHAGVLTGKKSALLFGNKDIIDDPVIIVEGSEFDSGYNNIKPIDQGQLEKIWSNYEKAIDQILSKKVMIDGESISFKKLPVFISGLNTGLTNLNITQKIDHAKEQYSKQTNIAIKAINEETLLLNQKLGDLENRLSDVGGVSISFQKINSDQLLNKLNNIQTQGQEVGISLSDMNVYYNLLSQEGINKTIEALKQNAKNPKMRIRILFVSLATLHLSGATRTRSRIAVNKKIQSTYINPIVDKSLKDLMFYAYQASQQDTNLQSMYESMVEIIKDKTHLDLLIDKYLLGIMTQEQSVQIIKLIVSKNRDQIDIEMGNLYNDTLLGTGDDAPKKSKYSDWLLELQWSDPQKTKIIFADLFIGSEMFRTSILNNYLEDVDLDITSLTKTKKRNPII